jgi:predicted ATPase
MKIERLFVPEYKNVTVNLELHAKMITLLVGQNGMGKSNLIEILLLIFDELNQLAEKGRLKEKLPFHYALDYECKGRYFSINKITDEHSFAEYAVRKDGTLDVRPVGIRDMELPDQIIGYYSGENKRIRTLVEKHIKSEERSKRIKYSRGNTDSIEPRKLFFAENRHSMLVLATLLLYRDHPEYGETIGKVLQDVVHIDEWDTIHLRFRNPNLNVTRQRRKQGLTLEYYRDRLKEGEELEETNIFWGIMGDVDKLLRLLLQYSMYYKPTYSILSDKRGWKEYFDIESIPRDGRFKEYLYDFFPTPLDFLNVLEECYVLDIVEEFDIRLKKTEDKTFYPYLQLSEGEQQYLLVMGLIALSHSGHDDTLFLLDEPDTHINPQWQRSYIEQIKKLCSSADDERCKAFFISTHSPLLVQTKEQRNKDVDLLLFKRDENGRIQIDTDDDTMNNWRIDQVLMSKYFDLPSSRPASLDEFMERRISVINEYDDKGACERLIDDADEFGYLPTGETISDVEAMVYIHKIAEELRQKGGHL